MFVFESIEDLDFLDFWYRWWLDVGRVWVESGVSKVIYDEVSVDKKLSYARY